MVKLYGGDSLVVLKTLAENSVDSIICDPPYGLSFMGKKWDYDVPSVELWREVFRVLKPGGHVLSFGGTRTYHRMVVNIEDAGFEIRDQIMWIYGSGFPKSHDVSKGIDKAAGAEREVIGAKATPGGFNRGVLANSNFGRAHQDDNGAITAPSTDLAKQWQGWGTALKPANEPIVLARKPLIGTVAQNVEQFGTGALNIDASRIEANDGTDRSRPPRTPNAILGGGKGTNLTASEHNETGRWPANILFDEEAAAVLDAQSGTVRSSGTPSKTKRKWTKDDGTILGFGQASTSYSDKGGASRFFKVFEKEEQLESEIRDALLEGRNNDASDLMVELGEVDRRNSNESETQCDQKHLSNVEPVTSPSNQDEQLLNSVREAVKTNFKNDPSLSLFLDSIPDSKKCSLYQDLALLVAEPQSIGTTEIIQSLLRLYGSVHPVTGENINSESLKLNSDPTRFLYQAKASKRERNAGMPEGQTNGHPTIKPVKLMEYLIKLVTPPGGVVLDPFMGSGTTGVACRNLGFEFVGVELSDEYLAIAKARIGSDSEEAS